jgi:predicted amino acid racemase
MFVDATLRRNPALVDAAFALHRDGRLPANCYVIDVDTVGANAAVIAQEAAARGLSCYQMTKQFGRNPLVASAVAERGIPKVVAVDIDEARVLAKAGLSIGHVGHLVQIPRGQLGAAMDLAPDVVTVFGLEQAAAVAGAARAAGRSQPLLLRVVGEDDVFYPAQRGGVPLDDVVRVAETVGGTLGVSFAGVTSFPCLLWNPETSRIEPTPNLATLGTAVERLAAAGIPVAVVNAPSATCVATLDVLASAGATQVEPGSALTGHTPLHAVTDQPEVPAMVYLTEVTHRLGDTVYTLGGGFYPRSRAASALVRAGAGTVPAAVEPDPADAIDYYGCLRPGDAAAVRVGDPVVYAFRSQVFVSRSFVAVVAGVATEPRVLAIHDHAGNRLGEDLLPAPAAARDEVAP